MKKHILITSLFFILWAGMGISFFIKINTLRKKEAELREEQLALEKRNFEEKQKSLQQKRENTQAFFEQKVYAEGQKVGDGKEEKEKYHEKVKDTSAAEGTSLSPFQLFEEQLPYSYPTKSDFSIYGNSRIDRYIQAKAKARGYTPHKVIDSKDLEWFKGKQVAKETVQPLKKLIEALEKEGADLSVVSGYRSPSRQRKIFRSRLGNTLSEENLLNGKLDEKIEKVLSRSSIPGYSKHHTGHAFDFVCNKSGNLTSFGKSKCYEILSKDNFALPKQYGFLPSYPEGETQQGPEPEPWKFIWLGTYANEGEEKPTRKFT